MDKKIFIFLGPSGSGKTSLSLILKDLGIPELISHTTRPIRKKEIDKVHYYFVNDEEYNQTEFIEFASYGKYKYGLSKKEVNDKLTKHNMVYASVERKGVESLKKIYGDVIKVIYVYCSPDTLRKRMKLRGDSDENIELRIANLYKDNELNNIDLADYVIINDKHTFEESVSLLMNIIDIEEI